MLGWLQNLGFAASGTDAVAATVAGYDYDTRKKQKRRRVIIDGLTYFVTPAEEAALLRKFIDSIERKAEQEKPEPKATKPARQKAKAVAKQSNELQQRLDRLKVHLALLSEENAREAAHFKATIEVIERRNREARATVLRQYDDEALALILAVA